MRKPTVFSSIQEYLIYRRGIVKNLSNLIVIGCIVLTCRDLLLDEIEFEEVCECFVY